MEILVIISMGFLMWFVASDVITSIRNLLKIRDLKKKLKF